MNLANGFCRSQPPSFAIFDNRKISIATANNSGEQCATPGAKQFEKPFAQFQQRPLEPLQGRFFRRSFVSGAGITFGNFPNSRLRRAFA